MRDRVEVLHVLGTAEEHGHALARIVAGLARSLDPSRFRLSACFLSSEGPLATMLHQAGVNVRCVDWRGEVSDALGVSYFVRELRELNPDIIHFHVGGMSPRLVARTATKARIVAHFHSLREESKVGKPKKRSTRFASLVMANSAATAARLDASKVLIVHPSARPSPAARRQPPRPGTAVRLGTAARLVEVKGLGFLVDALALLRQDLDVELHIAGSGPKRKALAAAAAEAGLGDAVRFLGWRNDISDVMQRWHIYVQPSFAEGFGLAVLEAMAAGLPVVAGNAGGLPEVVVDGETGFLVEPGDPAALAARIRQLIEDPALARRMGDAGRERVARHFTPEREAAAISAAYDKLTE
ncbi:MAG: glycosyltransferase [Gemmatimonadaceae bacterium]